MPSTINPGANPLYLLQPNDCIGDSLGYFNINTQNLLNSINNLTTNINSVSALIGSAPSVAKAWVSFQPSNISNIITTAGVFSRTSPSTVITVTINNHMFSTGMVVQINFTGAAADVNLSGLYPITYINNNQFTVNPGSVTTTRTNISCNIQTVNNFTGYNVSSIAYPGNGQYAINFTIPMNNSNYAFFINSEGAFTRILNPIYGISKDKYQFGLTTLNGAGGPTDYANVYTVVYGY